MAVRQTPAPQTPAPQTPAPQTPAPQTPVRAVIFDWGGTLTPWHQVDHQMIWRDVCVLHFTEGIAARNAAAIRAAERELWRTSELDNRSATMGHLFERAGVIATDAFLASYFDAWEPHTLTDPDACELFRRLRETGIKIGVLSNTMWPRAIHERVFDRDGILGLIDGAVYSSEIDWTKPHPEAFRAAMAAVGVGDPAACVFVGDRPYDDVYGAKQAGMRAVLVPHSDVPACAGAEPDAVITRLADIGPLIDSWRYS